MPVQASQLERLSEEQVPAEHRGWAGRALLLPINRLIDLLRVLLNRGVSLRTNVNCQVVERKFTPPSSSSDITEQGDWSTSRLDTPLTISGPVLGVQVLACWTLDTAGHDVAPVGNLPSPAWREVVAQGQKHLRLTYQYGLSSTTKYRLVLLIWGQ